MNIKELLAQAGTIRELRQTSREIHATTDVSLRSQVQELINEQKTVLWRLTRRRARGHGNTTARHQR